MMRIGDDTQDAADSGGRGENEDAVIDEVACVDEIVERHLGARVTGDRTRPRISPAAGIRRAASRSKTSAVKTRVTMLLTSSRAVTGLLDHGERRLSDALNDSLVSVFRLSEASLGRLGNIEGNEPVATCVIQKAHTSIILAHGETSRPAEKRLYSYIEKQAADVLVLVAGLRVRGFAHATRGLDPVDLHRLVAEARDHFVALTEASLAVDVEGTTQRDVGTAMLNVRHIQFVALVCQPEQRADGVRPA